MLYIEVNITRDGRYDEPVIMHNTNVEEIIVASVVASSSVRPVFAIVHMPTTPPTAHQV